jgi:hypothetical protein
MAAFMRPIGLITTAQQYEKMRILRHEPRCAVIEVVSLFDYSSNYNCIEQEMIKTDIV